MQGSSPSTSSKWNLDNVDSLRVPYFISVTFCARQFQTSPTQR
ncbi:MAG: hypothetical protein JWP87_1753, partial [Labilithrix sp.]|nr:hypothetical protein [Labilithrix sp.]